jgi:hypothetical protein
MTASIKVVIGACDASRLPLEERHAEQQEKCKRQWLGILESKVCNRGPKEQQTGQRRAQTQAIRRGEVKVLS